MNRKLIFSGLAAGALAVSGLAAIMPGASAMPAHPGQRRAPDPRLRAHPKPGHATCFAMAMPPARHVVQQRQALAAAFTPTDIQKAYNLTGLKSGGPPSPSSTPTATRGSSPTSRPSAALRPAGVHDGQRLLHALDQNGGSTYPPTTTRAGTSSRRSTSTPSRPPAPTARSSSSRRTSNSRRPRDRGEHRRRRTPGVVAISNSYGGQATASTTPPTTTRASPSRPPPVTTASTRGGYPASDTTRGRRRRHLGVRGRQHPRLPRDRVVRRRLRLWARTRSRRGRTRPAPPATRKAVSDVSAAADPSNGGLNIYCGSPCGGFAQVGGTSEASPIIAAVFALSGKTNEYPAKYLYEKKRSSSCTTSPPAATAAVESRCARRWPGWDGPTGMGTPNGVKAF